VLFDGPVTVANTALGKVDNNQFRYYRTVELDTASPTLPVNVSSIQFSHLAA
jgi:hypothetical protein